MAVTHDPDLEDSDTNNAPDANNPSNEAMSVRELENQNAFVKGSHVFVVSKSWWTSWESYATFPTANQRPGPIDNSSLLPAPNTDDTADPVPDLQVGKDFVVVSEQTWRYLHGIYSGGPAVEREVLDDGSFSNKRPRLEMYVKMTLHIHPPDKKSVKTLSIPKKAVVAQLKTAACKLLSLLEEDVIIWDYYHKKKFGKLEDRLDSDLESANLQDNQDVLLVRKDDGDEDSEENATTTSYQPPAARPTRPISRTMRSYAEDSYVERAGALPGQAGLGNLGNTCFMNSSLQCLAHTLPLMKCFLGGSYKGDINRGNPLGMKGELAEAFGRLICSLWQGGLGYVSPRAFKAKLAEFAPQFSGYQQHDSQEFLAFLLDGLHEDLNRIRNKPYIEEKDSSGRPDDEVAVEAWTNYRARNDSSIVDHFQGLYKSTLDCPNCGNHSIKFDPFMYLSLPLPESRTRTLKPILVWVDGSAAPVQVAVEVAVSGSMRDVFKAVAAVAGLGAGGAESRTAAVPPEQRMAAARFHHYALHTQCTVFSGPKARVSELQDGIHSDHLVVYLYPSVDQCWGEGRRAVVVFHRRLKPSTYSFSKAQNKQMFSAPLLLWVGEEEALFEEAQVTEVPDSSYREYIASEETQIHHRVLPALRPFLLPPPAITTLPNGTSCAASPSTTHSPNTTGTSNQPDESWVNVNGTANGTVNTAAASIAGGTQANGGDGEGGVASPSTPRAADAEDHNNAASMEVSTEQGNNQAGGTGNGGEISSSTPGLAPFNMWEPQEPNGRVSPLIGTTVDITEGEEGGVIQDPEGDNDPQPAFQIKLAQGDRGSTTWATFNARPQPLHSHYVIEWGVGASEVYDVGRLDVAQEHPSIQRAKARKASSRSVTLKECLDAFVQPEELGEDDPWYCPRCKSHVQATKKLDLWSAPEVLVVHLKRFQYTSRNRNKLETLVDFPMEGLDLSSYMRTQQQVPPVYKLFAVSNHYGGLGGGHYTAAARMPDSNKWYNFDDSHVSELDPSSQPLQTEAAYVLFYRREAEAQRDAGDLMEQLMRAVQEERRAEGAARDGDADQSGAAGPSSSHPSPTNSPPTRGYFSSSRSPSPPPAVVPDNAVIQLGPPPLDHWGQQDDVSMTHTPHEGAHDGWELMGDGDGGTREGSEQTSTAGNVSSSDYEMVDRQSDGSEVSDDSNGCGNLVLMSTST